ncbi:hypothetical protein BDF20DRAFT_832728 [Mycotypha africana]|uniref:uncharacterized protein n=1 Tax=Mycotypha africana TaxID=64632 RepID=UPI0023009623|nr:uncharacterized protein BDF20DRAFT_832728 [Mycotypha africana]KAI8987829.1 hypothetical protein BDF20DRAFT_832728 [Mycotypha africana]
MQPNVEEPRPLNVKDALTYLDKVKSKFSSQPEVYTRFLDIMKDFKGQLIDTPGVIERVSTLFRGKRDLISGFSTFLPTGYHIECTADDDNRNIIKVTAPTGTFSILESEPFEQSKSNTAENGQMSQSQQQHQPPLEFNQAISYVNKVKNRFLTQPDIYKRFLEILQTYQKDQRSIQEVYAEITILFEGANELLDEFKHFLPKPNQQPSNAQYIPPLIENEIQVSNVRSNLPLTQNQEPVHSGIRPTFSAEEAEFFENVKTYIGNKATYNAFLKVLNLFSQQIVDQNVLVNRVESFIGGNLKLFNWFKRLVGYDEIDYLSPDTVLFPHHSTSTNRKDQKKEYGPSYRRIRKSMKNRSCGGRDALCWDVLNDSYVSQPTCPSEDTGFVAAKKNQYEEALHRVEEERYDYDSNIEANLNTIALLEPIAKKISIMTPEEKANFKLTSGLADPSRTVYQRIMKKIYAHRALEMMDLLHNNPAQAVPIVLKRLKQKDEEWKRAQREWNKIWREVEAKNYWKSLDYQGISFKISDRKAITTRSLIAQATSSAMSFELTISDSSIFKDISRLIYFYLDKQPIYNSEDCASMRNFMDTIIPIFFDVVDVAPSTIDSIEILMGDDVVVEDEDEDEDDNGSSSQSSEEYNTKPNNNVRSNSSTTRRTRRGRPANNNDDDGLLKDVLKRNINTKKKPSTAILEDDDESSATEIDDGDNEQTQAVEKEDEEMSDALQRQSFENSQKEDDETTSSESSSQVSAQQAPFKQKLVNNNINSSSNTSSNIGSRENSRKPTHLKINTLASLIEQQQLQQQQQRSQSQKSMSDIASFTTDNDDEQAIHRFFGDNGFYCFFRLYQILYERLYKMKSLDTEFRNNPRKAEKARVEAHDLGITPKRFKALQMDTKRGYYNILLCLIDKLFEGDIDQQTFEECVRYVFGADAYIMFTIDKLVLAIVRHIHIIVADNQSQELCDLFLKEYEKGQNDPNPYLEKVIRIVKPNNIYYITFSTSTRKLRMRFLKDGTLDGTEIDYDDYVKNYIDWSKETKGINVATLTPRFLKRNLKCKANQSNNVRVRSGMQYKICRDTYHMFYIIGTEDVFIRYNNNGLPKAVKTTDAKNNDSDNRRRLNSKWQEWLNQRWHRDLTQDEKITAENVARARYYPS